MWWIELLALLFHICIPQFPTKKIPNLVKTASSAVFKVFYHEKNSIFEKNEIEILNFQLQFRVF
jgi:hypothetical protein